MGQLNPPTPPQWGAITSAALTAAPASLGEAPDLLDLLFLKEGCHPWGMTGTFDCP